MCVLRCGIMKSERERSQKKKNIYIYINKQKDEKQSERSQDCFSFSFWLLLFFFFKSLTSLRNSPVKRFDSLCPLMKMLCSFTTSSLAPSPPPCSFRQSFNDATSKKETNNVNACRCATFVCFFQQLLVFHFFFFFPPLCGFKIEKKKSVLTQLTVRLAPRQIYFTSASPS